MLEHLRNVDASISLLADLLQPLVGLDVNVLLHYRKHGLHLVFEEQMGCSFTLGSPIVSCRKDAKSNISNRTEEISVHVRFLEAAVVLSIDVLQDLWIRDEGDGLSKDIVDHHWVF